jgi:hypothetical protein
MPTLIKKPQVATSPVATGTPTQPATSPLGAPVGFMKSGSAALEAVAENEAKVELARDQASRPWRFRIPEKDLGKDFLFTFLDGDLIKGTEDLYLNSTSEHNIKLAGKYQTFVCLQSMNPPQYCPICAMGENPRLVCVFTVIDHQSYQIKVGPKAGKMVTNQRRLLVVTPTSLGLFRKIAAQQKGLAGLQVSASRSSAQKASIGDMFLPTQKYTTQELMEMLGKDEKGVPQWLPFNYEEVMPIYTAEQMAEMGIGSSSQIIGNEPKTDFSNKL